MRSIFGAALVASIVAAMASYAAPGDAPQPAPPQRPAREFNYEQLQSLRQHYIALAQKRVEQMSETELQEGIAEMHRQALLTELATLSEEFGDNDFGQIRANIALAVLAAKDRGELDTLIRILPDSLDAAQPTDP